MADAKFSAAALTPALTTKIPAELADAITKGHITAQALRDLLRQQGQWYRVGGSNVPVSVTGGTGETTLATVTIPAGAMGPNGVLKITSRWTCGANNANSKLARVRLGGAAGTQVLNAEFASTLGGFTVREVQNMNSQAAQDVSLGLATPNAYTSTTAALVTGTIDTSVAQDLVFQGQLAVGSDTLTLRSYRVEVMYGA